MARRKTASSMPGVYLWEAMWLPVPSSIVSEASIVSCDGMRSKEIGGFADESRATLDDWEFFSRAALLGLRIETMPEVHLWYREDRHQDDLIHSLVSAVRSVRPYIAPGNNLAPAVQQALQKVTMLGLGLKLGANVYNGVAPSEWW